MATKEYLGKAVEVDGDGHLVNFNDWSEEIANEIAKEEEITMTKRHWDIVNFMRKDFQEKGVSPTIRKITKASDITTKEIYDCFPKGPGRRAAKVAGLPKPVGCL